MTTTDTIKALRDALTRLIASDPVVSKCSDDELMDAANDPNAPEFVNEQAAAMLQARSIIALTADASEDAPDATPSELEQARLAAEHYGRPASDIPAIVAFERHRNEQKRIIGMAGLNALPCYIAGFNTGRAARPAPVAATPAPDLTDEKIYRLYESSHVKYIGTQYVAETDYKEAHYVDMPRSVFCPITFGRAIERHLSGAA